jgi:ribosomal-protein-alanine N-acetyltransferase
MRLALAQLPHPTSFQSGLDAVLAGIGAAAAVGARVVCFPECCLKGMRGAGFPVEALTVREHDLGLEAVRQAAATRKVHVVLPTERFHAGVWQNGAYVVEADGSIQGYQTKNQLPAQEESFFQPGSARRLFRLDGVVVSIAICHEGWRYPETVRWGAARGAQLVFHPHFGGEPGSAPDGPSPAWGESFYEKAMACRAGENTVWFASVNFALSMQHSATTLVSPDGEPVASAPLHADTQVVVDLDPALGTGFLAKRFAPGRYGEG